jgi:hypothetical protein
MSSLTTCNYCQLKALEEREKEKGYGIYLQAESQGNHLNFIEVYRVVKGQEEKTKKLLGTSFLAITLYCVC